MFIISKRNFVVQRPGKGPYQIRKDFVGEIPDDVASHWLVQAAIEDGTIATPHGKKDAELEKSDQEAAEKAAGSDIRPDAKKSLQEQKEIDGKDIELKDNGKRGPKNKG